MGKATRMLAITGMAMIAGATIGAPAMAAAPSAAGVTATATPAAAKQVQVQARRDRVVGYYRSRSSCEFAGRIGERRGHWDDYDCYRVHSGFRRGWWALEAQWDNHGNGHHGNGNNHGHGNNHDGHGNGNNHGNDNHGHGHGHN
jgi:hypothetical protein